MRAGKLRHRITLQKFSNTPSSTGANGKKSWVDVKTVWASFEPLSVKDVLAGQAVGSQVRARCIIRYQPDINSTMQVVHNGKTYKMDGDPLPDRNTGCEYLTLLLVGA